MPKQKKQKESQTVRYIKNLAKYAALGAAGASAVVAAFALYHKKDIEKTLHYARENHLDSADVRGILRHQIFSKNRHDGSWISPAEALLKSYPFEDEQGFKHLLFETKADRAWRGLAETPSYEHPHFNDETLPVIDEYFQQLQNAQQQHYEETQIGPEHIDWLIDQIANLTLEPTPIPEPDPVWWQMMLRRQRGRGIYKML